VAAPLATRFPGLGHAFQGEPNPSLAGEMTARNDGGGGRRTTPALMPT